MNRVEELRRGWPVLLGAIVGVGIGVSSLPYYTFAVFLKELEGEFGWSRAQLSAGQTAYLAALALASPLVGRLIDRFGVRRVLGASLLGLAFGFVLLGTSVSSLPTLLGGYALLALAGAATSPLAYTRVVNAWFVRMRGLALGLTLTGTGIAAALSPYLLTRVMQHGGWRDGYLALAVVILSAAPLVLLLLRATPPGAQAAAPVAEVATASPVFRSRVFWQLAFAFLIVAVAINGLAVHFIALLTDAGVSRSQAAATAGLIGISVIVGRIVVGALVDRFVATYVAASALMISAIGMFALFAVGVSAGPIAACAIGLALGAEADLLAYLTAKYFPLEIYGRVYGVLYAIFMGCTGLSPIWIGAVYDRNGDYSTALVVTIAGLAVSCVLFLSMPRRAELTSRESLA